MFPSLSLRQLDVSDDYHRHTLKRLKQLCLYYDESSIDINKIDELIRSTREISTFKLGEKINRSIEQLVLKGKTDAGLRFGSSFSTSSLSGFNIALQSAPSLEHAIILIARYCPLIESILKLRFCQDTHRLYIYFEGTNTSPWMYEDALAGCWQMITQLSASDVAPVKLAISIAEPSHSRDYQSFFPVDVAFNAESTFIQLEPESWQRRMARSAKPVTELFAFWLDKESEKQRSWLVDIYRYVLDTMTSAQAEPSLPMLAMQHHCSVATMKRRLALEGKNFTQIKDEIKMIICYHYLTMTSLPLNRVAEWTGFTNSGNFSRACSRWFGVSPRTFRKQMDGQ